MANKGKLIVLEGIDGSGKSTQFRKLCKRLEREGIKYHHIDYPRYKEESSALIRMYLAGDFGKNPSDVNANAASVFYAVDRYASYMTDWKEVYERGELIIADRYTTSNAVHQGAKVEDGELENFLDWLYDFEYVKLGLPKPDAVIYLDVDVETSMKRTGRRESVDIHEKDAKYLESCVKTGTRACEHGAWQRIDFMKNGKIREIDDKHEEIYKVLKACI